jgi:hypothetical protein
MNHLLSETARWITETEFVYRDGSISKGRGESIIDVKEIIVINNSRTMFGENKISHDYVIRYVSDNEYSFESVNPELGTMKGVFNIDRNIVFSKFAVHDTSLNGFEIIRREDETCFAHGALYDGNTLIDTWNAVMKKV